MSIDTLTSEEQRKLKLLVDTGIQMLQEIADKRESLKDAVKTLAEELGMKPAILNKAISAAFKENLDVSKETIDDVEELLTVVGRR